MEKKMVNEKSQEMIDLEQLIKQQKEQLFLMEKQLENEQRKNTINQLENYKTAIFNGFVAGFCFYAFLIGLLLN